MLNNYKGEMRRINNEYSGTKNGWDREASSNQFPKSKYERSQISYYQSQSSVPFFQEPRTERIITRSTGEEKQLFNDNIPVKIKSFERQDQHDMLRIHIGFGQQKNMPYVLMHLTNDNDPLFLYNFQVKESDYINLKNEQSLKVDFSGFPQMMQSQLKSLRSQRDVHSNQQQFFYSLIQIKKGGDAVFNILESRKYKQTNHLSLKFKNANDEQLKKYLAGKFMEEKMINEHLRIQNSKLQQCAEQRRRQIEKICAIRNEEKQQLESDINCIKQEQSERINKVRRETQNQWRQKQKQARAELMQKQDQFKREKKQTNRRYEQLNSQYKSIFEKFKQLQINFQALERRNQNNQYEMQKKSKQVNQQQRTIKQGNDRNNNLEKKIVELETTISGFQRQLNDKQSIINSSTQIKQSATKQIFELQQKADEYRQLKQKFEKKFENLEVQLQKERKQKDSIKNKYQKKKQKNNTLLNLLTNQQNDVQNLQNRLEEQKQRLKKLQKGGDQAAKQNEQAKKSIKKLKQELSKSNELLEDKIKLIEHLNNRLNQKAALTKGITGGIGSTSYSGFSVGLSNTSRDLQMESRLKYSNSNLNDKGEKNHRIEPPMIRRYTGTTPVKEKQVSDRALSPSLARLNQQADPQDDSKQIRSKQIKPVKFKFGQ